MVVSINRNSKIFDTQVTDELNKAFSGINDKISAYKSEPLEYKEEVHTIPNSNSFRAGNILSVRETVTVDHGFSSFETVKTLNISIPYEVWSSAITENNENLTAYIYKNELKLYGSLSKFPQKAYIVADIVLPN
ncbi:MAG: hypothetical protein II453_01330 [Alphaproteobacteria bacterium]|nr:hypothetical protein [Alphaproteobacteria bacterium]